MCSSWTLQNGFDPETLVGDDSKSLKMTPFDTLYTICITSY